MKVHVYCNNNGRIVSILEVKEDKEAPPTGLLPMPDLKEFDIELTDEQSRLPLISLHTGYKLDLRREKPRLVPLVSKRRKSTAESSSEE
jgi:hypothetical protein